jgi:hypothetical protein
MHPAAADAPQPRLEPGSPWENGYVESFNGKLRDELLDRDGEDVTDQKAVDTAVAALGHCPWPSTAVSPAKTFTSSQKCLQMDRTPEKCSWPPEKRFRNPRNYFAATFSPHIRYHSMVQLARLHSTGRGSTSCSLGLWGRDPVTGQDVALTPEAGTGYLMFRAHSMDAVLYGLLVEEQLLSANRDLLGYPASRFE